MLLSELHNPKKIVELFHLNNQNYISCGENQAFQELQKMVELWERLSDGMIYCIKRWRKTSVICFAQGKGNTKVSV